MKILNGVTSHASLNGVSSGQHHRTSPQTIYHRDVLSYAVPGWFITAMSTKALVASRMEYLPIVFGGQIASDRIGINVTVAGAPGTVARLGYYAPHVNIGNNILVGDLIEDFGTVAVDSTGVKEITISTLTFSDIAFLAVVSDGTPTIKTIDLASPFVSPLGNSMLGLGGTPSLNAVEFDAVDATMALPTDPTGIFSDNFENPPLIMLRG